MSLPDEHLQQALQHAPDRVLMPDNATRKAVIDYAAKALYTHKKNWLQRCQLLLTLDYWHVAPWQLAGMGSAISLLLVVVVFWGEPSDALKDESIQMASKPIDGPQKIDAVQAKGNLAESGLAESKTDGKSKMSAESTPPANTSNSVAVATNEALVGDKKQDKTAVGTSFSGSAAGIAEAISPTQTQTQTQTPTASTPPQRLTGIASNQVHDDVLSKLGSGKKELAKNIKSDGDVRAEVQSQSDISSIVGATLSAGNNNALVLAIAKEGGQIIANKDIQSGTLRLLRLEKNVSSNQPQADKTTGYPIQTLTSDDVTEVLIVELDAYNQVMRNWHARDGN